MKEDKNQSKILPAKVSDSSVIGQVLPIILSHCIYSSVAEFCVKMCLQPAQK